MQNRCNCDCGCQQGFIPVSGNWDFNTSGNCDCGCNSGYSDSQSGSDRRSGDCQCERCDDCREVECCDQNTYIRDMDECECSANYTRNRRSNDCDKCGDDCQCETCTRNRNRRSYDCDECNGDSTYARNRSGNNDYDKDCGCNGDSTYTRNRSGNNDYDKDCGCNGDSTYNRNRSGNNDYDKDCGCNGDSTYTRNRSGNNDYDKDCGCNGDSTYTRNRSSNNDYDKDCGCNGDSTYNRNRSGNNDYDKDCGCNGDSTYTRNRSGNCGCDKDNASTYARSNKNRTVGMINVERQEIDEIFESESALRAGTLFPELHKPMNGYCPCDSNCGTCAQAAAFAAWELRLYLNTHPNDKEALALFRKLCKEAEDENYATTFLTDDCCASGWKWVKNPWPWEYDCQCGD